MQLSKSDPRAAIAVTFVTLGLAYGFWYTYSVFLVVFLREFSWSRSLVAGVFSVLVLVHGLSGPIVGRLIERIGARPLTLGSAGLLGVGLMLAAETTRVWHLYLSLGVIAALGISGVGWVPAVTIVRAWFPKHVGTALGVASAGIGIGISAMVPLAQWLIDTVGWRWAMRLLAAGIVGWIVPATAWLGDPPPPGPGGTPAEPGSPVASAHWTLRSALRSWRFWGAGVVFSLASGVTQMLLAHQVAYLVDHGVPALVGAVVVGVVGLASIVGKTGWGVLSDRIGREPTYTAALACVLLSIGTLALSGAYPHSPLPYVYAVLIGVGYAATAPLTPAVSSDLFGGPRFASIFGALSLAPSLGGAVGAWLAGWTFDATGSYSVAFWGGAGVALVAPVVLWLVAPRRPNPPPA